MGGESGADLVGGNLHRAPAGPGRRAVLRLHRFKANKFNEANQKYLTEVHYTYQLQPLVISERVFKKMTPEMQKVIVDAGKYAQDAVLKFQLENAEAAKKELIAGGLVVSQLEDEDLWKKAAIEKVWPEMADFVGGKDAINEYLKACGKDAWK